MKKLINDPRAVVRQMLEGLVALAPGQALLEGEDVVLRVDLPPPAQRGVAVLSGGGAGHEPAHAGYVGPGLLHAAIAGDVFTSPSTDAVLAAIRAAAGPAGALLVVKNYTGDRLNFGLAAELARAEGIPVEMVLVADDVALRDTVAPERRRGIAGTVLVHKVAGAAAAAGHSLEEVAAAARAAAASLGSMGVALGACTVPAAGRPGFAIEADAVELGLGIHGEQGVRRAPLQPADSLVETLLDAILTDLGLAEGARVALLVNGLGGTPPMELAIIARAALAELRRRGIAVERAWCGNYLTAIEMPGCSLSLLVLDAARLALLDAPASAPAWIGDGRIPAAARILPAPPGEAPPPSAPGPLAPALRQAVQAAATALEAAEAELTALDSAAGDGDLGISMARGAAALRALPDSAYAGPAALLEAMGQALRRAIGGSSGPFYAVALLRAARALEGVPAPGPGQWADAFAQAVRAVAELGGARAGDRTMLDSLLPAAEALSATPGPLPQRWAAALAAAEQGLEATARMAPRQGRAAYLGERAIGQPDAGAAAVLVWMRALRG
ncbi:dihydroxyacetone kinase family protein [Pseudoroseomonas cervicalis]|uniref:dihydroxyacetone kinase family protein n=1 Tax=Teichococcus cervicalis TaxID=204525 RepID=UPI0027862DCD|nr:dihydroxyacetone kinase family protein [Pseudoroseomonas cervicalis]MDQ1078164.1 ATP-dependent dihydroxyacetone kinase [Pseudoroseomonas cervicalis]